MRPDRFVFQLTSNGFETTPDLANRSCIIRIRKRRGYKFRRYPEGDLLNNIAANQPRYLDGAYCVAAQWKERGKPGTDDIGARADFASGRKRWIGFARRFLGCRRLWTATSGSGTRRKSRPQLAASRLPRCRGRCRLEESLTASDIVEMSQECALDIPGLASDAVESKAKLRVGTIMGKVFKERNFVECEGFAIQRTEITQYSEAYQRGRDKRYAY